MKPIAVFFSYEHGNHYNGVYPTIAIAVKVVNEFASSIKAPDVSINLVEEHLRDNDDWWHEFYDTSCVTITEVSEDLVASLKKAFMSEDVVHDIPAMIELLCNSFNTSRYDTVATSVGSFHKTIQQNVMKLVSSIIKVMADLPVDPRNEEAVSLAKALKAVLNAHGKLSTI